MKRASMHALNLWKPIYTTEQGERIILQGYADAETIWKQFGIQRLIQNANFVEWLHAHILEEYITH